jgi:putative alpha-1,2-mannosidase
MGGSETAVTRLDEFFVEVNAGPNRPHAWIGNEPSLNAPWAYDFAGVPARTQAVVRRIQMELFDTTPGGLPGNDDGGTISAWYVLSALGVYPAVPGVGGLAIGSPLFPDIVVHLANGDALHIVSHGAAPDAPYVQSLSVDGSAYEAWWIDWQRLSTGATLDFTLGTTPAR